MQQRASTARQRTSKHAFLTIRLFSVWSVPKDFKRTQMTEEKYRTVIESSRVESSELANCKIMARKELGGAKKASCVI
jgi:hypothetical protein